jgi:hypothetical protein
VKVSELSAILKTISPDAVVKLCCANIPALGEAAGDIIYVAITQIDGNDKVVMLTNCVNDKRGNPVFDAPPQIKRFKVSTSAGSAAAIADLTEQMNCEPTQDLCAELEKEKLRDIFRSFEDLLNQAQTNKSDR